MSAAIIFGCAGPHLTLPEADLFRAAQPAGFILFKRNIQSPRQVKTLVGALTGCCEQARPLVLIDQEGGRVCRLGPPHWRAPPPAAVFGALWARSPENAVNAARINGRLIGADLAALGITMDCAPVIDLRHEGADAIIGDRAFGSDPEPVAVLGRAFATGLGAAGIIPVVKHTPGHGRATADSHRARPLVDTAADLLCRHDFAPFRALSDLPVAMTAHIVYSAFDPDAVASESATVINNVIRKEIGFTGLLLSDDLSMAALSGAITTRARACLTAGCDIALHCNGDLAEMRALTETVGPLSPPAQARLDHALRWPALDRSGFDGARALVELNDLLGDVTAADGT